MTFRKVQNPGMFFIAVAVLAEVPFSLANWFMPNACMRILGPWMDCPPPVSVVISLCVIDYVLVALLLYAFRVDEWQWLSRSKSAGKHERKREDQRQ